MCQSGSDPGLHPVIRPQSLPFGNSGVALGLLLVSLSSLHASRHMPLSLAQSVFIKSTAQQPQRVIVSTVSAAIPTVLPFPNLQPCQDHATSQERTRLSVLKAGSGGCSRAGSNASRMLRRPCSAVHASLHSIPFQVVPRVGT